MSDSLDPNESKNKNAKMQKCKKNAKKKKCKKKMQKKKNQLWHKNPTGAVSVTHRTTLYASSFMNNSLMEYLVIRSSGKKYP